jgi:endonuclease/exonuclease/phosphatase family metal-dependent hydrolase
VPLGSSFVLGQQGTGGTLHNFNGTIDNVRVYPRALTAAEVSALYAEAPAIDPNVFTVLTWNTQKGLDTHGSSSLNTIADKIIISGADVALLSAVNNQSQADTIKARLGIKWTCTFYQITTEGQAICSKYPVTDPDHHDVNVAGQTEPQAIVKATVTIGGRPVSFFAIDAQHNPSNPFEDKSEVRHLQAIDMSLWADSSPGFPEPRIVGGDFNEASGAGMDEWMTTYYDGWPNSSGSQFGYATNTDGRTKSTRLDHILSSRGASAIVQNPPFVEARVWDMRDFGTSCTDATNKIGSAGCSVCSSSPPPSNSICTLIDNTAVRPSDHIPFTMKFRFVQ